jgi:hypothetical protein
LIRELRAYKEKDKIAYARIMKACRLNPKTKLLCERGTLTTANEILVRLRQRFRLVDETMKASTCFDIQPLNNRKEKAVQTSFTASRRSTLLCEKWE